ncbi:thioredoxin [Tepidicaulis sp. LMO-SS28]|uniref:thioredoxin n=1 Tax=Tepidicaulis sp. LMO-SS28 TaxID=3447455 RepID=UPI003EE27FC9
MEPHTPNMAGAGAAPAAALIKDTTTEEFAADVIEASREVPVIVDFWAPWCGPCKQLTPILEKVVTAAGGAVRLVKMNIDEHPMVAQQLRVQSIPAVFAFKDGQPVDGFMGALPESQLKQFIERLAGPVGPSPLEQMLEAGTASLSEGDINRAAQLFAGALQEEPGNPEAIAGLAQCYLKTGDTERAKQTLELAPPDARSHPALSAAEAAIAVAEKAAESAKVDTSGLEARLAENPKDHEARFELALAKNAKGDREGAVDDLLLIIEYDKAWNEEAARKQLVEFFEAYGPMDEVTKSGRRRLSSILFS